MEQSLEVEAGAPLVNTQDAAVKTIINQFGVPGSVDRCKVALIIG